MKEGLNRATALLHASLEPPRHELNELDWKSSLSPEQRSMVSVLIQEAVDAKLIKPSDPENRSKKFAEYMPLWA